MAAAVFGGSPRHHSSGNSGHHHHRSIGGSKTMMSSSIASHLAHSSPSLQHPPSNQQPGIHSNPSSNIVFAPSPSFISSAAPVPSMVTAAPTTNIHLQQHHPQYQPQQHPANIQHHLNHQQQQQHHFRHSKRKTAVEMLAESKPFYVKSETVLDHQQQLSYGGRPVSSGNHQQSPSCNMSPSRTPVPHLRNSCSSSGANSFGNQSSSGGALNRRSCNSSSSSDLLQTKLRTLLNTSQDHTNMSQHEPHYKDGPSAAQYELHTQYTSPKKLSHQELSVLPDQNSDISVFFPSAFLSPQSLPPHPAVMDDDIFSYGIDDALLLTEDDYQTISPPAEYAEEAPTVMKHQQQAGRVSNSSSSFSTHRYAGYQRSYSHSPAVGSSVVSPQDDTVDDPSAIAGTASGTTSNTSYNINSHKSLPDLHSQISRHSPHSEALSCCSRGNRSNKSSSSFNRDSGGSSGHYTHRSEPANAGATVVCGGTIRSSSKDQLTGTADFRRDSGSSTQHSGNSYYAYGIPPLRYDCMECRAKIQKDANCLLNFTTPEVPEAFQDDYSSAYPVVEKMSRPPRERFTGDDSMQPHSKSYYKSQKGHEHGTTTGTGIAPQDGAELSPPLGTFKRQRCLRAKQRGRYSSPSDRNYRSEDDRRPILRSKSDISDRYYQRSAVAQQHQHQSHHQQQPAADKQPRSSSSGGNTSNKSESITQLERFFDRLGLNEDAYEECIVPKGEQFNGSDDSESDHSSPVFFSDASTVDSTRLPDSTEVTPQQQMYRPSEPPSIVERNARIIKWLCNCRKLQLT